MSIERDRIREASAQNAHEPALSASEVSAAVRARTILAICHEVWCDPGSAGTARLVGLLDVGGLPYLVFGSGLPWIAEGAEVGCVARTEDVGALDFTAWLGRPRMLVRDRAALQVFNEHRRCLQGEPGPLEHVVAVPVGLLAATVAAPVSGALAVEVSPDAVDTEEPDWLLVHGSSVAAHLESSHAQELSDLAQRCGWPGASVCIRRLSASGVALDVLTVDGVTRVDVPFEPPIRRTTDLWPRLTAAVSERPGPS